MENLLWSGKMMLHIDFIKVLGAIFRGVLFILSTFNFQCFSNKNIQNFIVIL